MKRIVSGIKPSCHSLTLGNYLGAIKQFIKYQSEYEMFIFIADLHSLTIYQDPKDLRENINNLIYTYLAAGLDLNKVHLFKQSDIVAHNQLEWVLTCNTQLSELTKMPQYKNYLDKHVGEGVPTGMLMYPSLMNADILLYDADYVPVGLDQKPHIDLTRDIAESFNKTYGEVFKLPEALISANAAKIMSLSNPTVKMSKSESDKGTIYLDDNLDLIRSKIMKAKTDSENKVYFDQIKKPGISNLLTIYAAIKGISIEQAAETLKSLDYKQFKTIVADTVVEEIGALQRNIARLKLVYRPEDFKQILDTATVNELAEYKIKEIYAAIGLA